jgi:branched-chain amino acid transport system permease protein
VLRRPGPLVLVLLAVLLAAAIAVPFLGGTYAIKLATRVVVLAIFVLSLDLLIGITGLVSFGHAMFFGLGAYAISFLSPDADAANALIALPAAALLAGLAALAIGALAVLTRGFYFIMVTLAFGEMTYSLFHDTRLAGGSDGAYINVKPQLALGSLSLLDFERRVPFYYFCLALLVLTFIGLFALASGPLGRVLQGIRWNEVRVGALGFNSYSYKLVSFTLAGGIAGVAGALFAMIDGYVTPDLFGWRQSGFAIMMLVLGGVGTLAGAIVGAILYSGLEEVLKSSSLVGPVAAHWSLALGAILIAAVLAAPRGVLGWLQGPAAAARTPAQGAETIPPQSRHAAPKLEVIGLSRRFTGLLAVDNVSLALAPNRAHVIIGPNGAGKTTFINLLSGTLPPSSGRILLDGQDVTGLPPHAVARLGVGRSYQITNVVLPFTAEENCRLAAQARQPSPLRLVGRSDAEVRIADAALQKVGLEGRAGALAAHLSHGEQRQLEIAMLLASGGRLLLLDEPLAGMGAEETGRVTRLVRQLAQDHTVILIEHDLDAVFAVADTITVLVAGRLLAHGTPDVVRQDAAVRDAYLGTYGEGPA